MEQQSSKRDRIAAVRAKAAAERAAAARRARRIRLAVAGGVALVVVAVVVVGAIVLTESHGTGGSNGSNEALGPEGMPLEQGTELAADTTLTSGATAGGVQCNAEQAVYHIHTHLAVYVNGALRPLPPGIGIVTPVAQSTANGDFYQASNCYYWLHVHAQDGIIHVEAPTQTLYTLGQFFQVWQQPLSSTSVAGASGTLTVYVDGKRYTGDPASIPLQSHEAIQIDVGKVVPFQSVDWSKSQL